MPKTRSINKRKIRPFSNTSRIRKSESRKEIDSYAHTGAKRKNNPQVGLVSSATDKLNGQTTYQHDPYIDPYLSWAGKAEGLSFDVQNVSLHVHERIDPKRIAQAFLKRQEKPYEVQLSLFDQPENEPPLNKAVDFYRHEQDWTNRLIAGDSLLVMNSLLHKEGMAGKVQMVYIDPPYGIKYNSNFQPFTNKRDVKDGKDEDIPAEPEMIQAFRDTWELGIHSYLTYLRNRLLLAKELLHESGSCFVQISEENLHHVRALCDEIFKPQNFISIITFTKTKGQVQTTTTPIVCDYLIQFAKDKTKLKYRQLYKKKILGEDGTAEFRNVEFSNGEIRRLTEEEYSNPKLLPAGARIFATTPIVSQGYSESSSKDIELEYEGRKIVLQCGRNRHWSVGIEGTKKLWDMGRLLRQAGLRIFKSYLEDFPYSPITNVWSEMRGETDMTYVVQTNRKVIERCILMSSDPGDLILDITCGSGTTAYVAEQWGRRWITCDTSRVAITLAKQRLMTANFDYFALAYEEDGVGTRYEISSTIKLDIANKTTNRITFKEIYEVSTNEGRVVIFEIPAAPKAVPVAWEGHYYGRDGESLVPLNIQEIEQIRHQSRESDWSAQACETAALEDLDTQAVRKARDEFKIKNPKLASDVDRWDDVTFLNKAKVLIAGKITRTAIILLGRPESEHFISPGVARISWILKNDKNIEKDYEHLGPPFILNADGILSKIRNLKYRFLPDNTLFPTEILQYEPYVIREALHNCIAHQDYELKSRIIVVERPDELIFTNAGSFIPGSVEEVIRTDAPQKYYRNAFLAEAMVNLNMIDTIGGGIKKMFQIQKDRFFPLPTYKLEKQDEVTVIVAGKIIDENYTKLLMRRPEMELKTVMLLDKVQKNELLAKEEARSLKSQRLIEGRYPKVFIASQIAALIGDKSRYIKNRGLDKQYYKKLILDFIREYGSATRKDIDDLLFEKLPNVLNAQQKKNKVNNLLNEMANKDKSIKNEGSDRRPQWVLR